MSPEQAMGEDEDWRTDIFSFGVILYEIACGRRPFEGKNAHATMYQIAHAEPSPPALLNPSIAPALAELIGRCLKKEREQRVQSMDEVAGTLADLTQRLEAPARNTSRRLLVGGGAAGAAAIAAAMWWPRPAQSSVRCWIEAQRVRDGVETGAPYMASSSDVFEGGWKFRVRVRAEESGFLYLVNEGLGDNGATRLWVLQPPQGSSAAVEAGREIVTRWFVFDQNPGSEKVWIVWSQGPRTALERTPGEVRDPAQAASIRSLLSGLNMVQSAGTNPADGVRLRVAEGVAGGLMELRHR
jgi:hypothetical protein